MRSSILTASLLLCGLGGSSGSGFESRFMQVQPGEDVTMFCSNFSSAWTQIIWFRAAKGSNVQCISSIFEPHDGAKNCDGFKTDKFTVSSNLSTIFLRIIKVNSSDSGLYFCGNIMSSRTVMYNSTHLEVHEESIGCKPLPIGLLSALTVLLLVVIIYLAVRIRKLQKAVQDQSTKQAERRDSNQLDYAAVTFRPNDGKNCRQFTAEDTGPNVIYATPSHVQDAPGAELLVGNDA